MNTPEHPFEVVDLGEVERLLERALCLVRELNGKPVSPPEARTHRDLQRESAALSKDLLFLAHLCEKSRCRTNDWYQVTRGFTAHMTEVV